jgi:hypothetical protein
MIPEFTKKQKKDNLKKAVEALRNNPKKTMRKMMDDDGGRCCLCVMAHVAEDICGVPRNSFCGYLTPKIQMSKVFAIAHGKIMVDDNILIQGEYASVWNDGFRVDEKTHAEIADMLEKEYLS